MSQHSTLLMVDDEPDLREALASWFQRKGFKVITAASGHEAIEKLKNEKVDVVVSDIRMPDGDGLELLASIRRASPLLPIVILITGFADITAEEAYERGADAIISKPFMQADLHSAVLKAMLPESDPRSTRLERHEVKLEAKFRFPEIDLEVSGKVMNIGRGGFFANIADRLPFVGAQTEFEVQGPEGPVRGKAIVRWIREEARDGRPRGAGLEFSELPEHDGIRIMRLLQAAKRGGRP